MFLTPSAAVLNGSDSVPAIRDIMPLVGGASILKPGGGGGWAASNLNPGGGDGGALGWSSVKPGGGGGVSATGYFPAGTQALPFHVTLLPFASVAVGCWAPPAAGIGAASAACVCGVEAGAGPVFSTVSICCSFFCAS